MINLIAVRIVLIAGVCHGVRGFSTLSREMDWHQMCGFGDVAGNERAYTFASQAIDGLLALRRN